MERKASEHIYFCVLNKHPAIQIAIIIATRAKKHYTNIPWCVQLDNKLVFK